MGPHVHQHPLTSSRMWRKSERGKINVLTVLILLAVAAAVYMAIMIVPAYVQSYKFEEKLRGVANQAHRVKDEARLLKEIQKEAQILELNLPYDAVTMIWDPRKEWLEISARYARVIRLRPFESTITLHFDFNIVESF